MAVQLDMKILLLLITILFSAHSYIICSFPNFCNSATNKDIHNFKDTAIFTSKHYGRFGQFPDVFDSQRPVDSYKKLVGEIDVGDFLDDSAGFKSGSQKRKERERDLNVAKANSITEIYAAPGKQRKWNQQEINEVISCLNLSYGIRCRDDLTASQRVGLIDWGKFDEEASKIISGYEDPVINVKKKVVSWIKFHREKREIEFIGTEWKWIPRSKK